MIIVLYREIRYNKVLEHNWKNKWIGILCLCIQMGNTGLIQIRCQGEFSRPRDFVTTGWKAVDYDQKRDSNIDFHFGTDLTLVGAGRAQ